MSAHRWHAVFQVRPTDQVLDMCAAPGGKTVLLAQMLFSAREPVRPAYTEEDEDEGDAKAEEAADAVPRGRLVANEPTGPRLHRLRNVLQEYIPRELLNGHNVACQGFDAT